MEPISQERLEAFWKRWGFKDNDAGWSFNGKPINRWDELPDLTLDSLFKYAVPAAKIHAVFLESRVPWFCSIGNDIGECTDLTYGDTPALALFLALEKLPESEGN